jgi:hypothetical protein
VARRPEDVPPSEITGELLGLPDPTWTVEGSIDRYSKVATHATRARDGLERPVFSSHWAAGLWLVLGAFGLLMAVLLLLYLLS